jgi:hypothetical protein
MLQSVAGAGGNEVVYVFERVDASAGANGGAVESGGGASKFELTVQGPVLEKGVDESGVEDIASSCGVDYWNAEGGDVEETVAIEGEDSLCAKGSGGEACVVSAVHFAESLLEGGFGGETGGKVAADDQVVDVVDQGFDVWVEFVEVGDDGNVSGASPVGGLDGGFGIVAVDVKRACVGDPFALKVSGVEHDAFVAATEDGPLALGVDEDERLGAGNSLRGDDVGFDAGMREGFAMESSGEVVAEFADVAGAQTPLLAGDNSGGDLSSGKSSDGGVFGLGAASRVGVEGDDGVGGVKTYADEVYGGSVRHCVTVNEMGW